MTDSRSDSNLKIGGILLAAGGSSRLGKPKQLTRFHGVTLLQNAAEMLAATVCRPIVAVLGAESEAAAAELTGIEINVSVNPDWQAGMSSSINCGLNCLLNAEPALDGVVIALCDQPLVTAEHIGRLVQDFALNRSPITAASYGETLGVPALFARSMFDELLQLVGDKGARRLIRDHPGLVRSVPVDEAAFDIDTADDLRRLTSS